MKLQDAVAVVTGASRGIGKATAIGLAREGAHVICTARSTEASPSKAPGTVEETARQVQALGRRALAIPCDISREEQVEALAERTLAEFGRVDIVINNAGGAFYMAPFLQMPMKGWEVNWGVNVRGPILCTRAFLPQMLKQGSGRIVNVSSAQTVEPWLAVKLGNVPYYVTKLALEGFTVALALELRPHNIPVNCLRIEKVIPSEGWPLDILGLDVRTDKPEVAVEAILWLATCDPSYTGHVVTIDEARWELTRGSEVPAVRQVKG